MNDKIKPAPFGADVVEHDLDLSRLLNVERQDHTGLDLLCEWPDKTLGFFVEIGYRQFRAECPRLRGAAKSDAVFVGDATTSPRLPHNMSPIRLSGCQTLGSGSVELSNVVHMCSRGHCRQSSAIVRHKAGKTVHLETMVVQHAPDAKTSRRSMQPGLVQSGGDVFMTLFASPLA